MRVSEKLVGIIFRLIRRRRSSITTTKRMGEALVVSLSNYAKATEKVNLSKIHEAHLLREIELKFNLKIHNPLPFVGVEACLDLTDIEGIMDF